jgi:hypothetical protein
VERKKTIQKRDERKTSRMDQEIKKKEARKKRKKRDKERNT